MSPGGGGVCRLKFLTELVTFITSPALSWRILPALENKQAGLVSLLCSALTAYVRNVSLEDIYLPVLLRACESMGRFLQQRYVVAVVVLFLPVCAFAGNVRCDA